MTEMVSIIELVYNEKGQPIDFYTKDINLSFIKLLNKTKEELINKKITSVVDIIEDYWFSYFASVDKTGQAIQFKSYGAEFDKYYFVSAWKISKKRVGISMTCITEREKAKIALLKKLEKEKKVRIKKEQELKEKSFDLRKTIDNLDSTIKKIAAQNIDKDKQTSELNIVKTKLEEQNFCLNKSAIVTETDTDGNITFVNDNFCEIYGYQRAELIGKSHRILKSGQQPDSFFTKMMKTIYSGKTFKDIVINKDKGGKKLYWMDITIIPFKDLNRNITKFTGIMFDITSQIKQKETLIKHSEELDIANKELAYQNKEKDKRANELILANKEKEKRITELAIAKELRQFIETSNAPIFGVDNMGVINEWNQAAEKVTGYKKNEALGASWIDFTPVVAEESVKKILNFALKGKQTANFEFFSVSKKGKEVVLLINISTRRNELGHVKGVLAVGQDITELVGYRNGLEKKVIERTLKLNQALENQKELNKLKSKFVSTASHEFRTPLSAINFAAGSIKKYWDKMDPIVIRKKLSKIESQILHMTRLLDDILIIGEVEANKIKNSPKEVHFGNFIEDIIEEVSVSREKSHKIELIDPQKLKDTNILIDEKLGRNIFTNLISNALKYSPKGKKVIIEISTEKRYILISITDFGIGISPEELKTIFTPFSRGKNVDLIQGTGLGLSIAKESVDLMKGEIIVKSTIGKGASFIVKIPKKT
jgi:PAS domain S-box-containing protein